MDLAATAIRLLVCPKCVAPAGYRCVTRTGNRATYPHSARTEPLYEAWRDGYSEALDGQVNYVRRLVERGKSAAEVLALLERNAL